MKKNEYREAFRLTDREKARVWNEVRAPQQAHDRRRGFWLPASAGLAAAACGLAAILLLTADQPDKIRAPGLPTADVAVRSSGREAAPVPDIMLDMAPRAVESARGVEPAESVDADVSLDEAPRTAAIVPGVIAGTVRDAETGEPMASATVIIESLRRVAVTDAHGRFRFIGMAPGRYTLRIRHLGYGDAVTELAVAADATTGADVAMAAAIAETLLAFDVERRVYMGEPRGALVARTAGVSPRAGAEAGGRRNPNDRPYDLVYHDHYGVNPFVATDEDSLSTFGLETDDASWTMARRYLDDGHLPDPAAIRVEEMVNRLDAGLTAAGDQDFTLHADGAPSRFGKGYQLLRLGVRARDIPDTGRAPAHLVFVIDISGSMDREDRLGLVKQALRVLVGELRAGDRVGIVTYGDEARVVLEPVGMDQRDRILAAIDALQPGGSTSAEAALTAAYDLAVRHAVDGAVSRLILCSDGVANVGATGPDSILESVRRRAAEGVALTCVGFGMGNYNDTFMEQVANRGDGTYHYVQRLEDAERAFRHNLTGTLQYVGAEVKTQVAFDPAAVLRWRLIGYENRDIADEDFRDDTVDAGEIGAGHAAVALYEVKLTDEAAADLASGRRRVLGEFRLRWARPRHHERAGEVNEIARTLTTADLATTWDTAPARLRAAAVTAEFAEIMRHSYWARGSTFEDLLTDVTTLVRDLPADQDILELSRLIHRASTLTP